MTREEQIKSLEEKGFDIKVVNKLVSLAWMCSSSAMDATNELDEYMTKYGFKGLFYNDLRAIKRDYEVYAKKIRASISGNEISNFFKDFDTFNAMVHDWAQLEADNKDFSMLSIHLVGDKLKVHKKGLKSLLENKEVLKLLKDAVEGINVETEKADIKDKDLDIIELNSENKKLKKKIEELEKFQTRQGCNKFR